MIRPGLLKKEKIFHVLKSLVRIRNLLLFFCLSLVAVALMGCQSLGFYKQAVQGQYQIWHEQRSIPKLIADPQTPAALKEKLQLVMKLREFAASDLHLKIKGYYESYADLHRRFVVWNVNAAPEFSVEPKSWWYPVVGRLKYRGYFVEKMARSYGTNLAKKDYDVFVGGVEAYSTLGWFRDPVLNTFINNPESDLAETLFHELAHHKVFVGGDTDFNEAFATTVGEEGVRRWFQAKGDPTAYRDYLAELRRNEQFVELVRTTRAELKAVYGEEKSDEAKSLAADPPAKSDAEKREEKARVIARLREQYQRLKVQWGGYDGYDHWFSRPLNNAQLNTVETYYHLVPGFRRLLQDCGGDLDMFYETVKRLTKLSKDKRHQKLEELVQSALVKQ